LVTRISAIPLQGSDQFIHLIGNRDETLRAVGKAFGVKIRIASEGFLAEGKLEPVEGALQFFDELSRLVSGGYHFLPSDIAAFARSVARGNELRLADLISSGVNMPSKKRQVIPKGVAQKEYLDAIRSCDCVFGIGPAGTGKTYLAMAMAVAGLMGKAFSRIVLTRPVVEAGEKLGFLPGDMQDKVNPYLRPLFDAMHDMVDLERAERLLQRGDIEIAPLAYMRGRSLSDSFIILDEAQNTTPEQMKMFLTRLGSGSKAVVTGDITQIDLPSSAGCGLIRARDVLGDLEDVRFIHFTERDVIRTELVRKIVRAYEAHRD